MIYLYHLAIWLLAIFAVWLMYCSNRTMEDRAKIRVHIWALRTTDTLAEMMEQMKQVRYNQHLWWLLTFRDYRKLYPFLPEGF